MIKHDLDMLFQFDLINCWRHVLDHRPIRLGIFWQIKITEQEKISIKARLT